MSKVPWLYLLAAFLVFNSIGAQQQVENHDDIGGVTISDSINRDDSVDGLPEDPDTNEFGKTRSDVVAETGPIIEEPNIMAITATDNDQMKPENRTESSETPKKSKIGAKIKKGVEHGPANRFPSLIPSLEYLDPKHSYELPYMFKFSFEHEHNDYVVLATKEKVEVIQPLPILKLIGQQMLWNLNKEDIIESFVGMDISGRDSLIKNFKGCVVTKLINGFPKRLLLFTYSVGNKTFVVEPDIIYLAGSLKQVGGKDIQVTGMFNLNGIEHFVIDVTEIIGLERKVLQINMFLTGDQTMLNNSLLLEQTGSSLVASDKLRYYMLSVANKTAKSFNHIRSEDLVVSVSVMTTSVAETPEKTAFIESSLIGPNTINGSAALELFLNNSNPSEDVTRDGKDLHIYMTRYNIEVDGKMVDGISYSGDLCSRGMVLIRDEEFYKSSNVLSKHTGLLLGIHYDGDGNECLQSDGYIMSTGIHPLTNEHLENSEDFSLCARHYLEKSLDEVSVSNQKCLILQSTMVEIANPYVGKYPGEVFDLNAQCQMIFGQGYIFQWSKATQNICKLLTCKNSLTSELRSLPLMRALEGSSCRSGAWCKKNICTDDRRAPIVVDGDTSSGSDEQASEKNFVITVTLSAICVAGSVLSLGFLIFLACWTKRNVKKLSLPITALDVTKDGKSEPMMDGSKNVE